MISAPAGLLVTVAAVLAGSNAFRHLSPSCPELCVGPGCHPEPEECGVWGGTTLCGRRVCYKGPDEECGAPFNKHGLCATSLSCKHGKCMGCVLLNNRKNCSTWDHHDFTDHTYRHINRYRNTFGY